jgi:ketosteroid isomerase-like protein
MKSITSTIGEDSHSVSTAHIAEVINLSYQEGFSRRFDFWDVFQESILERIGSVRTKKIDFDEMFHWKPEHVDRSDNKKQLEVIHHHYSTEFGSAGNVDELLKDYSEDTVIYEVIDDKPETFRGKERVKEALEGMIGMATEQGATKIDLEHVKINHNHAQVIWKAETSEHKCIVGTDSFTFDKDNHIAMQSTVALSRDNNDEDDDDSEKEHQSCPE